MIGLLLTPAMVVALATQATAPPPDTSCKAPEYRQLDFWVGDWDLTFDKGNGVEGRAENHIKKDEFGSCVIVERFRSPGGAQDGGDFWGSSYSTYDQLTKSWRQVWVDNQGGLFDLRGGPVSGKDHVFELVNIEPRGPRKRSLRMIWQNVTKDSLVWRWQIQLDDKTWRDLWVLNYRRKT